MTMMAPIAPVPKSRSPQLPAPAVNPQAPHRALFGPPPLFAGEDAAAYDALLEDVEDAAFEDVARDDARSNGGRPNGAGLR
jgi:hypothetical protein